jgi:hypothetical protein
MAKLKFNQETCKPTSSIPISFEKLIDKNFKRSNNQSGIDKYIEETSELNKLITSADISHHLANLLVLGYISAGESYFREIIRNLILFDTNSIQNCEEVELTYSAALNYDKEMLPEALLEHCTFINTKNIKDSLSKFVGIKGKWPEDVIKSLDEYSKVCQLRHCIVHRFGKIGSRNAVKLKLRKKKNYLEKPLNINFADLQNVFMQCHSTIKTINNFIFVKVLNRTLEIDNYWSWDYKIDKKKFMNYYNLFISKIEPFNIKSKTPSKLYYKFRDDVIKK